MMTKAQQHAAFTRHFQEALDEIHQMDITQTETMKAEWSAFIKAGVWSGLLPMHALLWPEPGTPEWERESTNGD